MKTEKPDWLELKELHDAEMQTYSLNGRTTLERPRSVGAVYGPSESRVDQVGDGLIDVNHLMQRFDRMPSAEELAAVGLGGTAFYVDQVGDPILARNAIFIEAKDFEHAVQITQQARNQFALLPARVRARFENDPALFLGFINDPKNDPELYELGLKVKPTLKEPEVTLKDLNETLKQQHTASKTKKHAENNE